MIVRNADTRAGARAGQKLFGTRGLALVAFVAALLVPSTLSAHRLDEYLQASRLAIDAERIDVEIDLVPGVAVASTIFRAIDIDGDGRVSSSEAERYARVVLSSVALEVDGRVQPMALTGYRVPEWDEVCEGVGAIRLTMEARRSMSAGRHSLVYRNMHQPEVGVYLANVLVPKSSDLRILGQMRDVLQHELRVEYETAGAGPSASMWGLIAFASMVSLVVCRTCVRQTAAVRVDCPADLKA
jgi:hypothetical protein